MEEKTISETLEEWQNGTLDTNTLWYDCWCTKRSLPNRAEKLLKKVKQISESKKFDRFKTYVFFKNNLNGWGTYDDFRICDWEGDTPLYTVIPAYNAPNNKQASVWGKENNFEEPLFEGTWIDVKKWFLGK
jgi:hypothetical protein